MIEVNTEDWIEETDKEEIEHKIGMIIGNNKEEARWLASK